MGKAKKPELKADDTRSLRELVKDITRKLGPEADHTSVAETLRRDHPKVEFSESTVKQYVSFARVELGFAKKRVGRTGKSTAEPTISDLKNARKLAEELGMEPAKLAELVAKLNGFGDTATLESCLETLVELTGE